MIDMTDMICASTQWEQALESPHSTIFPMRSGILSYKEISCNSCEVLQENK